MPRAAVYTEKQARHWLAFLARNMQSHGQSMFLVEQLQPSWLPTRWQTFAYLVLSRTVLYGCLVMLALFGISITFFQPRTIVPGMIEYGVGICVYGMAVGIVCALALFLRTSERLPSWARSLARFLTLPFELTFLWVLVRPIQWLLLRYGRTLNDDIQPVERISWSWMNFLKGLAFLTIEPPMWNSTPRLNRTLVSLFWFFRIAWFVILAATVVFITYLLGDYGSHNTVSDAMTTATVLMLPSFFCGFFSAIRGNTVELKTAPNLGIRLSGRNALITVSINVVLALIAKYIFLKSHSDLSDDNLFSLLPSAIIIAGVFAWGRLGGLDFLAHYCLRLLLRFYGYAPLDYVRFLDYAATELGFLQKAGGGYVFMHRYLLEYFATSEAGAHGAAQISIEGQAAMR